MGFPHVYDYAPGKKSWGSYGLPREGTNVPDRPAGDVAHRDVPTCTLADRLADVRARVRAAGWDTCIVVNTSGVVLGRLGRKALATEEDVTAEAVMTAGPSTVRPSITLSEIVERMQSQKLTNALVTRSDGRLVGVLRRADAEAVLDAASSDPSVSP